MMLDRLSEVKQSLLCDVFVIEDELRKFYSESVCDLLDRVGLHLALSVGQWIQWLIKDINRMKGTMEQGRFLQLCGLVSRVGPS